jgi:nucleoside-diphosphate-sugar epimerase
MLVTTGLVGLPHHAKEADIGQQNGPRHSETTARVLAAQGVRVATMRLPPSVHGIGDHGFLPIIIAAARPNGVSGYLGDGSNFWGGVHRDDAARAFLLALEHGARDPVYHAVAESGVPFRDVAAVVGRRLGLPVREVQSDHFGWFARMAQAELSAISEQTRARLGWSPKQAGLLTDLDQPDYFAA